METIEAPPRRGGLPADGAARTSALMMIYRVLGRIQGYICPLCGEPIVRDKRGRLINYSADHVVPRARGGIDALGNLVLAHRRCNSGKGDREPTGCEMIWLTFVNLELRIWS